jgi:cytochrome d ubiquinol oxidase subunit II
VLAAAAVASIVMGWGVAQWDYILPESLTVEQAAAPTGTIAAVLVAFGFAVVLIVPSFIVLYVLDQRSFLPGEGVEDCTEMEGGTT